MLNSNSKFIKLNGTTYGINPVSDLNNFYTGISLFAQVANLPTEDWRLIIAGGAEGTVTQIAHNLHSATLPLIRYCAAGHWSIWFDMYPKSSSNNFGISKITDANNITDSTGLALSATEKNPSISGTLANQINTIFNWNELEKEISVYPTELNTLVTVTRNVPSNAKEVLINHNTLGDIHLTRPYSGVNLSYYLDEYYRIIVWVEWSDQNTISYKITSIGPSENYASHAIRYVWYR